jgi:hypothetical protein
MIMRELEIKSPELLELLSQLEPLVDDIFAIPHLLNRQSEIRYNQQSPHERLKHGKEPFVDGIGSHWDLLPWNMADLKDKPELMSPVGRPYLDLMKHAMKSDTEKDKTDNPEPENWKGLSGLTAGFPNKEPFCPAKDFWGETAKHMDINIGSEQLDILRKLETLTQDISYKYLGGSSQALCAFYQPGTFIPWHHNGNAPGYNILLHYNKEGKGNFYSYDNGEIVTYPDKPGWVCRAGIFYDTNYHAYERYNSDKKKQKYTTSVLADHETASWHAANAITNRFTLSTICNDEDLWEDLIDEIESA